MLNHCDLNDEALQPLFKWLPYTNLHELELKGNEISDEGLFSLTWILDMTKLHTLNLSDNQITDEGLELLLPVVKSSRLRSLDISWNMISFELKEELCYQPSNPIQYKYMSDMNRLAVAVEA